MSAVQGCSARLTGGATVYRGADRAGTREVALRAGDLWITEVHGQVVDVRCLSGALWVTREDRVDHVLQAGASLKTTSSARLVVTALRPAKLRVCWGEASLPL